MNKKNIGSLGESIARKYLEGKGYNIIKQNYRTKYAEIDLIAKKNNVLIFIEVRTKTNEQFGMPEETINRKKLKKLYSNANAYVGLKKWEGSYRIDAVCVVLDTNNKVNRIRHYKEI